MRVVWMRPRTGSAVLAAGRLGSLAHRPAHEQEQGDDRDLEEDHQPDESPRVHSCRSYTRPRIRTTPQARSVQLRRHPAELRDRVQLGHARLDLVTREALDAL